MWLSLGKLPGGPGVQRVGWMGESVGCAFVVSVDVCTAALTTFAGLLGHHRAVSLPTVKHTATVKALCTMHEDTHHFSMSLQCSVMTHCTGFFFLAVHCGALCFLF